jgi:hypothetical protein
MKNKIVLLGGGGIAVLGAIIFILLEVFRGNANFKPETDTATFVRNVKANPGIIKPEEIEASDGTLKGVRLSEIFSLEQTARYGVQTDNPHQGVGLEVVGVIINGGKTDTLKFAIKGWQRFEEEGSNNARNQMVQAKKKEFSEFISKFTSEFQSNTTSIFVVDRSEGISKTLDYVVRKEVDQIGTINHLIAFQLGENSYQGERRETNKPGEIEGILDWLLEPGGEEKNTSLIRGLYDVFSAIAEYTAQDPEVDVYTDGLENTSTVSVYRNLSLLEKDGWEKLDQVKDLSKLTLDGVTIRLHPLPPKSERYRVMQDKGLEYLKDRLKRAGATVTIKPF